MAEARRIGCLVIDGLGVRGMLSDMADFLRRHGVDAEEYARRPGEALHLSLQRAYQRVRRSDRINAIVASGVGCACALAVAAQLPVDRLVLLCPDDEGMSAGEYRRVRTFGRRNAALCSADTLIVGWSGRDAASLRRLGSRLNACRVQAALAGEELWTNGKQTLKLGVFGVTAQSPPE